MSVASVSSSFSSDKLVSYLQERTADLKQLGKDLKSGGLAAAQQDFNAVLELAQKSPFRNGDAFAVSLRQQDFSAIGQALQSGDLAGVQQAFSDLRRTFIQYPHPSHPSSISVNPSVGVSSQGNGVNV